MFCAMQSQRLEAETERVTQQVARAAAQGLAALCRGACAAQVSVVGHARKVEQEQESEAAELMFSRHPQMKYWAQMAHKWVFYELDVEVVYILDFFGGYHEVTREAYFTAKPTQPLVQPVGLH
jgi:hypothetical protein